MSINRVQKLLFSEYCDFEDMVLIESPFAQTTKEGRGLRQVHLGLTPSKLILATDILPPVEPENVKYNPHVDPEIETFELIAIYPVECINLSIYRRKRRQALKARFCNNRVSYFELGGFEKRGMFWNLWCEKVKFLCPGDSNSSRSETSVATSTTGSSLYLIDKKLVTFNGIKQLWCKFGPNYGVDTHFVNEVLSNNGQSLVKKWTDRYLYFGKNLQEHALEYKPITKVPYVREFVKPKKLLPAPRITPTVFPSIMEEKKLSFGDSVQVNRFGSGVYEGCGAGLYLSLDDYIAPTRYSSTIAQTSSILSLDWRSLDYEEIAETAVLIWEYYGFNNRINERKPRHRRRYGFAPKPLFLSGLGPWYVTKGDAYSLQLKRAVSEVCLRNLNWEKDLKLPVSRRQLFATVSCPALDEVINYRSNNIINGNKITFYINKYPEGEKINVFELIEEELPQKCSKVPVILLKTHFVKAYWRRHRNAPKKPVIYFWTPGYWYRPISAKDAYNDLQKHLKKIKNFQETRLKYKKRRYSSRKFLRKLNVCREKETDEDDDELSDRKKRTPCFISTMLGSKMEDIVEWDESKHPNETSFQYLKRILRLDIAFTAWDFDSTTLAQQLTLIDKNLFLKIPSFELGILLWQQSSKNAPNIAAMIAFSYRISCLISSEILRDHEEKIRARLIARFINVANKCHRISNFQSCRTVLCGLQNPAIFRLRKTWAYVRKKHASKYQVFEFLCRLYRDSRMPSYQKTFFIFSQNPPFLPYIGHIIVKLLDKVPDYRIQTYGKPLLSRQSSFCTTNSSFKSFSTAKSHVSPKLESHQNLFARIFSVFSNSSPIPIRGEGDCSKAKKPSKKKFHSEKSVKFKGLYEYYKPLGRYEDNRKYILVEVTELLEKCQIGAMNYNFCSNEMAKNFLLKARHYDEQENFYISLGLESSRPNSVRHKNQ